jgi:hypothetical protein
VQTAPLHHLAHLTTLPKNTLWICKLVKFWKSECRQNTLLERLGPCRIGVSLLWHRHRRSIKQCSPITYKCSELVKQNSIARAIFFCRYSRISIYISFTWVSKRGAPKVRKRHPCTTCPPMHNSEKWIFNLQASRVLKIENSLKYVIRTIGPWPYWCILIVTSSREIKKQCRTFVCT